MRQHLAHCHMKVPGKYVAPEPKPQKPDLTSTGHRQLQHSHPSSVHLPCTSTVNRNHSMLCSYTSNDNTPPPPYPCATCCVRALSAMLLMLLSASTRPSLLLLLAQCALTRIIPQPGTAAAAGPEAGAVLPPRYRQPHCLLGSGLVEPLRGSYRIKLQPHGRNNLQQHNRACHHYVALQPMLQQPCAVLSQSQELLVRATETASSSSQVPCRTANDPHPEVTSHKLHARMLQPGLLQPLHHRSYFPASTNPPVIIQRKLSKFS